jgi:hypothetical protein
VNPGLEVIPITTSNVVCIYVPHIGSFRPVSRALAHSRLSPTDQDPSLVLKSLCRLEVIRRLDIRSVSTISLLRPWVIVNIVRLTELSASSSVMQNQPLHPSHSPCPISPCYHPK